MNVSCVLGVEDVDLSWGRGGGCNLNQGEERGRISTVGFWRAEKPDGRSGD